MVSLRAAGLATAIAVFLFVWLALPALLRTVFGPVGRLVVPALFALGAGYLVYEVVSGWHAGG